MKIFSVFYTFCVSVATGYPSSDSAFRGVTRTSDHKLETDGIVKDPKGLPTPALTYEKKDFSSAPQQEARESLPHETEHPEGHDTVAASHHDEHPPPLHPSVQGEHADQVKHEEGPHKHGDVTSHHDERTPPLHPSVEGEHADQVKHEEGPHKHEEGPHKHARGHAAGESEEGAALAILLMGGVGSLMIVFYMVNHSSPSIKEATWNVLSMTASVFVAVLIYGTGKALIFGIVQPGLRTGIAITLAMFVCCFVGLHALLFKLKEGSKLSLQSAAMLMAHITGFAGMYGFSDSAELKVLEELDIYGIFLLVFGAAAFIIILIAVMDKIMKKIALADGRLDADEEEWIDICAETDDDVFCLAVSFLSVVLLRFLIRGELLPYEPGHVGNITQPEATQLLLCSMFFCVLVIGGTALVVKYGESITSTSATRAITGIQHLNSMTMAWCFLFWAEWQIYVWGWKRSIVGSCLVISVAMTMFSFCVVILTNVAMDHVRNRGKLARRASKSIELALGILVGFSWERAFDVGFEELEHYIAHRAGSRERADFILFGVSALLVITVAPAWHWHILSKTMRTGEEATRDS